MNAPDAIRVLELRLSGVGEGKYHVEGLVDGQPLIRREDEEIDVPFGLLPSIDHDGDYFMATCECGDPGCAGYFDPVLVTHEGELIHPLDMRAPWLALHLRARALLSGGQAADR